MCDGSKNCNFLFWNTGWFCALYTTCDELKTSEEVGTIFAKQGNACPGQKWYLSDITYLTQYDPQSMHWVHLSIFRLTLGESTTSTTTKTTSTEGIVFNYQTI